MGGELRRLVRSLGILAGGWRELHTVRTGGTCGRVCTGRIPDVIEIALPAGASAYAGWRRSGAGHAKRGPLVRPAAASDHDCASGPAPRHEHCESAVATSSAASSRECASHSAYISEMETNRPPRPCRSGPPTAVCRPSRLHISYPGAISPAAVQLVDFCGNRRPASLRSSPSSRSA